MSRYVHTYKYRILSKGPNKQSPIKIAFWKWGFGIGLQTNKHIMGFSLNRKKTLFPTDTQSDSYTHKYPPKIKK
jgi:hypothetical protein